jgi:hypothetical protein
LYTENTFKPSANQTANQPKRDENRLTLVGGNDNMLKALSQSLQISPLLKKSFSKMWVNPTQRENNKQQEVMESKRLSYDRNQNV